MQPDAPPHRARRTAIILIAVAMCSSIAAKADEADPSPMGDIIGGTSGTRVRGAHAKDGVFAPFQSVSSAPQPGSPHWSLTEKDGLAIELIQRPLDLTEAFYQGRGFAPDVSQRIAAACVLAVRARNLSASKTLRINLADWRVMDNGHEQPLRLEADWQSEWEKSAVAQPARIAFRYSMLPTVQSLGPGDWLQGMITANLSPGRRFDLSIRWTENDEPKQAWLRNVACAAESTKEKQP